MARPGTPGSLVLDTAQFPSPTCSVDIVREEIEVELEQLRDQLKRQSKLASIGQLAGSIAHEIRNPLGVIRNAVFLLRRLAQSEEPRFCEYLEVIEKETLGVEQIVNELMALCQGRAPVIVPVVLEDVLDRVWLQLAAPPSVKLKISFEEEPFVLHVDADQIDWVLRNLMSNAVQAMGQEGNIFLHARKNDNFDELFLQDTGPGVPSDMRPKIFEPLFTTKQKGTGLGLSLCKQIVEQHGGTIELLDFGPGAIFFIRLPHNSLDDQSEKSTDDEEKGHEDSDWDVRTRPKPK